MIASIQTVDDFEENFEFAFKVLSFIKEIDNEKRARFQFISQVSETKYLIYFKSYSFPGYQDYHITIEAKYSENQWIISLVNKSVD
ncbi:MULTISPECIES: hypothetical protein [Bacillus cereus group]|uniref:Uncharacterized protein n=1 Tax=Bacillus thuringiensis TaxID=1428 RepID=A0A9W3WYK6_BACTU|nr:MULTISPECIES: hypothetical protein [Bacillus cereus group]ANS46140.1 hypothetical protein BT246_07210 [Bacillus thuringiensis]KAB2423889.1 hypothetical protein F8167_07555 [Bacillus cereus]MBZ8122323.1 hypothetical protein [Bacillus thuringiensis]